MKGTLFVVQKTLANMRCSSQLDRSTSAISHGFGTIMQGFISWVHSKKPRQNKPACRDRELGMEGAWQFSKAPHMCPPAQDFALLEDVPIQTRAAETYPEHTSTRRARPQRRGSQTRQVEQHAMLRSPKCGRVCPNPAKTRRCDAANGRSQ